MERDILGLIERESKGEKDKQVRECMEAVGLENELVRARIRGREEEAL